MTSAPKPITPAELIPEGSALKRPSHVEELNARVLNAMDLSPKAQADRQRQAADNAAVAKVRAREAQVKPGSTADRMYGPGAAAQRAHDAKRSGKVPASPAVNQGVRDWHKGKGR